MQQVNFAFLAKRKEIFLANDEEIFDFAKEDPFSKKFIKITCNKSQKISKVEIQNI